MKKNVVMGILLVMVVVCVGIVIWERSEINSLNESTEEENSTLVSDVEDMIVKALDLYNGLVFEYDSDEYVDCEYGAGCMKITNYDDAVSGMFTEDGLNLFEYNAKFSGLYGITFIDDEPYIIDGYSDYPVVNDPVVTIISNDGDTIQAIFIDDVNYAGSESWYSLTFGKIELVKSGDSYLINSFSYAI